MELSIIKVINSGLFLAGSTSRDTSINIEFRLNSTKLKKLKRFEQCVAVYCAKRRKYLRGRVLIDAKECQVLLTDYGEIIRIERQYLRQLPDEFKNLEQAVFLVGLYGILPASVILDRLSGKDYLVGVRDWSGGDLKVVKLLLSSVVNFRIIKKISGIRFGEILVKFRFQSDFINIADLLISNQTAVRSDNFEDDIRKLLSHHTRMYFHFVDIHDSDSVSHLDDFDNDMVNGYITDDDDVVDDYTTDNEEECYKFTNDNDVTSCYSVDNEDLNEDATDIYAVNNSTTNDCITHDKDTASGNIINNSNDYITHNKNTASDNIINNSNDCITHDKDTASGNIIKNSNDCNTHDKDTASGNIINNSNDCTTCNGEANNSTINNPSNSFTIYKKGTTSDYAVTDDVENNYAIDNCGSENYYDQKSEKKKSESDEKENCEVLRKVSGEHKVSSLFDNINNAEKLSTKLFESKIFVESKTLLQPATSFWDSNLDARTLRNLHNCNIRDMKTCQMHAVPYMINRKNTVLIDQHKQGKSYACVISLISMLRNTGYYEKLNLGIGSRAIILCPSSEACCKMKNIFEHLTGTSTDLSYYMIFNLESALDKQLLADLSAAPDVLITNPVCLKKLVINKVTNFKRLVHVILDDATTLFKRFPLELKELFSTMEKYEIRKEIPLQTIIESNESTPEFHQFVKMLLNDNRTLLIACYFEAAIYCNIKCSLHIIPENKKTSKLEDLLSDNRDTKRTVIVCENHVESERLFKYLASKLSCQIFHTNETADFFCINDTVRKFKAIAAFKPILICTDKVISDVGLFNFERLIHYSLPTSSKLLFNRRFSLVIENCHSSSGISSSSTETVILLDHSNTEPFPKIVSSIKRFKVAVPEEIDQLVKKVIKMKEDRKKNSRLCVDLMQFGQCWDKDNCLWRHSLYPSDKPQNHVPPVGTTVKLQITHIFDATHFAGYITAVKEQQQWKNITFSMSTIATELSLYYSDAENRKPALSVQAADIVAIESSPDDFCRVKVLDMYKNERVQTVYIQQIDNGCMMKVKEIDLLHLPDHLKQIPCVLLEFFVYNLLPSDNDIAWTEKVNNTVKDKISSLIYSDQDYFFQSTINLCVDNYVWLDGLDCMEYNSTLKVNLCQVSLKNLLISKQLAVFQKNNIADIFKDFSKLYTTAAESSSDNNNNNNNKNNVDTEIKPVNEINSPTTEFGKHKNEQYVSKISNQNKSGNEAFINDDENYGLSLDEDDEEFLDAYETLTDVCDNNTESDSGESETNEETNCTEELNDTNFDDSNFDDSNFDDSNFDDSNFDDSNFDDSNFDDSNFDDFDFFCSEEEAKKIIGFSSFQALQEKTHSASNCTSSYEEDNTSFTNEHVPSVNANNDISLLNKLNTSSLVNNNHSAESFGETDKNKQNTEMASIPTDPSASETCHPKVYWHQDKNCVYMKIMLSDVSPRLTYNSNSLTFDAEVNGRKYYAFMEFYSAIDKCSFYCGSCLSHYEIRMKKLVPGICWLRLLKTKLKKRYITYDPEFIESDNDEIIIPNDDDYLVPIKKTDDISNSDNDNNNSDDDDDGENYDLLAV